MKLSDFSFELPADLIAHYPLAKRADSRMMCLDRESGVIRHLQFTDFASLLSPGDLLILNNTKVIPARLLGCKKTGGKVEVLVERVLDDKHVLAHIRASKSPKPGMQLLLEGQIDVTVLGREEDLFRLCFNETRTALEILESTGHIPLPPYLMRSDELSDKERYQTVYATEKGAVAAPTAGLHFDHKMLDIIKANGVDVDSVTLHVGAGTFQPVRVANIDEHKMHAEYCEVPVQVCEKIKSARARGNKVIAVGTTVVRALETASLGGEIKPYCGETTIFITPGFHFQSVDALLTNFHTPGSTLLMLVSAFARRENVLLAYQEAINQRYRFFSYGDCMYIMNGNRDEI